jgi:hypothetical protein
MCRLVAHEKFLGHGRARYVSDGEH